MHYRSLKNIAIYIFVLLSSLISCKNEGNSQDVSTKASENTRKIFTSSTIVKKSDWPNNDYSKHFKVDSSKFEVWAWRTSWMVWLELNESFENQMKKMRNVIAKISKETDIKELRQIRIERINLELLQDIASVNEIQENLRRSIKDNIPVSSMSVVSVKAYKSKLLNEFTNLFKNYHLEPHDYYIDKCFTKVLKGDSINYTMICNSIIFELKEIKVNR